MADRTAVEPGDKSALLARHPLFRELGPEVLGRLATYATTRTVARGTTLFAKGDPGECLFAVMKGAVQVTVPSVEGKNAVVNLIGEGGILGEIALLDGQPRTADAITFTDCTLMVIERREFIPLLRSHPDVMLRLLEVLCGRLRRTTEQVEDLMFLDLRSRLAKTLLRLHEMAKPEGAIEISQSDLGQFVGLSREMINKQLRVWAKDGWIRLDRRRITVLKSSALERIVAEE
jgi:CRP/FNR family transcriptional regulator, cyclic AMP receptor protein